MIVTAWNNGAHIRNGAGYGFKVSIEDRDAYFKPEWDVIMLELDGEAQLVEVPIHKESFWDESCRELIHAGVGKWLRRNGLAPWPQGNPPRFVLEPVSENRFIVSKAQKKSGGKLR
ncbi:MAG: hypothetical protein CVU39_26115 [Chloroflexi bacterium HGW-Chloroflexi-10]|nr:MAG: hypothetical protein CVU39_26115 [Chloroflexi bacterium HGW-Chloroflexi-10]